MKSDQKDNIEEVDIDEKSPRLSESEPNEMS